MEETRNKKFTHERRKQWKKNAKHNLKTHYVLLIITVAIAGVLGVQKGYFIDKQSFSDSRNTSYAQNEAGVAGATTLLQYVFSDQQKTKAEAKSEEENTKFSLSLFYGDYDEASELVGSPGTELEFAL